MKIVSLVPSLTKTICDLGLKDKIVGITNFCVDPKDLHRLAKRVGGTKDPDLKIIKEITPSHVIVNTEENRSADIDYLRNNFSTLVTFPKSPKDVPELLISMGDFLGVSTVAHTIAGRVASELSKFPDASQFSKRFGTRFVYMIWRDPWMAAGHDTYISKFLELLGFSNVVQGEERYPVVDLKSLSRDHIDVIFLSSEPWPFRRRDADALRGELEENCPQLSWIDGKALSWYGTTTLDALITARKPIEKNDLVREI
jgi:ABC-type Fe3+-hydroxamate transport system substrate-binding protein